MCIRDSACTSKAGNPKKSPHNWASPSKPSTTNAGRRFLFYGNIWWSNKLLTSFGNKGFMKLHYSKTNFTSKPLNIHSPPIYLHLFCQPPPFFLCLCQFPPNVKILIDFYSLLVKVITYRFPSISPFFHFLCFMDKTGISHPFTIVIISPIPFIALSSPFHNPLPLYRKERCV